MCSAILNYSVEGEGRPLLIVHGLFGSSLNWKSHARELAQHYQVYRVDLRNHGDSFHAAGMDYAAMADDLERLITSQHLDRVDILGHSMGGKVAMMLAHRYPQRVNKLIVADIAPIAYEHEYDGLLLPLMKLDLAQIKSRRQADEKLESAISERLLRQFLLQNLALEDGQARWKINLSAVCEGIGNITGYPDISNWNIKADSLFLRGANSSYISDAHWALIQQHFCQAQLVTIANAGHWLHFEQPRAFLAEVSQFLR